MLTETRDLHGGEPPWPLVDVKRPPTLSALKHDQCDVAVVGAGVSGALTASALAGLGLDVVVVDRRTRVAHGSTQASTAMIQFELDVPLTELAGKLGSRAAFRCWRRSHQAVRDLKALITRDRLGCAWRDHDALYIAGSELSGAKLAAEARTRRRAGLPAQYLNATALRERFGIDRNGAILSSGCGSLDPVALTLELLASAQRRGARIYCSQTVSALQADADDVTLFTSSKGVISAGRVVFATGYETVDGLPKQKFEITSSWALASKPLPSRSIWPGNCLIWEASDPYLYARSTPDHRIVLGGEDSKLRDATRRDEAIASKSQALLKKFGELFPAIPLQLDYAWAGAFAESPTGLPIIDEIDGMPRCLAILGCGGNGITFSMVGAQIAALWAIGKRHTDAALFSRAGLPIIGKA